MDDEEDEEGFQSQYDNGHWEWNGESLVFVSDLPSVTIEAAFLISTKAPTGTIEFREDIDLMEQLRFRRRYQRKLKPGQPDVITIQDVKDIAIFTAPISILSPVLINMLHLPTIERFLRSLILYCQYYLQIEEEMASCMIILESKVRTPDCDIVEEEYRDNLADLRLLVAKEYCNMLIGGGDMRKFHHMGPNKKSQSLSDKDARQFETLLRMCVQIVWLALGRKSFNQIELEVNRMFKTEIFNAVEHNLKTNYIGKMAKEEKKVLLGQCLRHDSKLNTRSPLMNEVFCDRKIDYRMMALGVIKCPEMSNRLQYMLHAVVAPEDQLKTVGVVVGILGMPRSAFDVMLSAISTGTDGKSKNVISSKTSKMSQSSKKSTMAANKIYDNIVLPRLDSKMTYFPPSFPDEAEVIRNCSETQRRRWQNRFQKLLHPQGRSRN